MKRESFIIYKSFYALTKLLKPSSQLKMFRAIFDYGFEGTVPDFGEDEVSSAIWSAILPQLKANNARYENGCKGAESGVMGGAPKGNKNAQKNNPETMEKTTPNDEKKQPLKQPLNVEKNNPKGIKKTTPKTTPNENENVNVNENDIYISPRVCACIGNENFGINDFLSAHSGVKIDGYSGEISGIDWKLLHEKFIDSGGWLDENFKALSVIVKKYQTIITGQYDKKRKARRETTNDVLDRMLREEYARQKQ